MDDPTAIAGAEVSNAGARATTADSQGSLSSLGATRPRAGTEDAHQKLIDEMCEDSCLGRAPEVGDRVKQKDNQNFSGAGSVSMGTRFWQLIAGEIALVIETRGNNDFRLTNPAGVDSKWLCRTQFIYTTEEFFSLAVKDKKKDKPADDAGVLSGSDWPVGKLDAEGKRSSKKPNSSSSSRSPKNKHVSAYAQVEEECLIRADAVLFKDFTPPKSAGSKMAAQRLFTPKKKKGQVVEKLKWNPRHQLAGNENSLKPKGLRDYFSKHSSVEELKVNLSLDARSGTKRPGTTGLLKSLSMPELQRGEPGHPLTLGKFSSDTELGYTPSRSQLGGTMFNRDGASQGFNDRFHITGGSYSHVLAPDQREYFSNKSVFETQGWRRSNHYEIAPGVWRPAGTSKPNPLGPLGVSIATALS